MKAEDVEYRADGAGHSFTNPNVGALGMPGFNYHQQADRRSWAAMLDLLDQTLGPSG